MTTTQRSTVVGVFEDRRRAQEAVQELRRAGFREDQIGVAGRDQDGSHTASSSSQDNDKGNYAGTGAVAGVAGGAGVGALWALGIAAGMLPAIGPVIAGGILASILASAAGTAVVAGIVGALIGLGIPEEEARYYEGEFNAGRTIVTVRADGRYDEAWAILQRFGAYDMRTASARGTSTAAHTSAHTHTGAAAVAATQHTSAAPVAATQHTGARATTGQTVQVREEELNVHKQPVQTGEVRVHKEVHTEHRTLDVPVQREEVVIERHPVSGQTASSADIRGGQEIRIPVKEEQVHVEKTPVVKEEVTVGKRTVQDTERVSGTVRKEDVRVEQEGDVEVREKGTTRTTDTNRP